MATKRSTAPTTDIYDLLEEKGAVIKNASPELVEELTVSTRFIRHNRSTVNNMLGTAQKWVYGSVRPGNSAGFGLDKYVLMLINDGIALEYMRTGEDLPEKMEITIKEIDNDSLRQKASSMASSIRDSVNHYNKYALFLVVYGMLFKRKGEAWVQQNYPTPDSVQVELIPFSLTVDRDQLVNILNSLDRVTLSSMMFVDEDVAESVRATRALLEAQIRKLLGEEAQPHEGRSSTDPVADEVAW